MKRLCKSEHCDVKTEHEKTFSDTGTPLWKCSNCGLTTARKASDPHWHKTSRLGWLNAFYPTWTITKRESGVYTLKHYRLCRDDKFVRNFKNLEDAKHYAESIILQEQSGYSPETPRLTPDGALTTEGRP